jgi:uncharacterized surface protein with fasciclin (FAS1) repeats
MKNSMPIIIGVVAIALVAIFLVSQGGNGSQVLPSPSPVSNAMQPETVMESEEKSDDMAGTIVDVAVSNGSFNTLVAAVKAAGLVETLSSAGPFTVFAPTDEAFAKLPKATLDALLADPKKLAEILTYHVVSGKVGSADVVKLKSAKTVQGQNVSIVVNQGKVMVNNANVVATDVAASNGVIHVIDTVLLPK